MLLRILKSPRGAVAALLLAALLWGSAFPAIKRGYLLLDLAAESIPEVILFAGIRFFIAGMLLLAGAAVFRLGLRPSRKQLGALLLLGLIQTVFQYTTFYVGLAYTTGIKASVIVASGSFFLAAMSPWFFKNDRLDRWRVGGLLIGFLGVLLANLSKDTEGLQGGSWIGDVLILITGVCSAAASLLGKRLVQDLHPVVMNGFQITLGSLVLLAVSLPFAEVTLVAPNLEVTGITLYLALVTAIAFTVYYLVVKYHDLSRVAAYRFLIPVSGVVLSALLIPGERLSWELAGAAVLVALGIWTVNHPGKRATPGQQASLFGVFPRDK